MFINWKNRYKFIRFIMATLRKSEVSMYVRKRVCKLRDRCV
jgi:hypothetical protein